MRVHPVCSYNYLICTIYVGTCGKAFRNGFTTYTIKLIKYIFFLFCFYNILLLLAKYKLISAPL